MTDNNYDGKTLKNRKWSKQIERAASFHKKLAAINNGFTPYQYDKHMQEMYGDDYDSGE